MKETDPPADKRVHYKHRESEQRGYAVMRGGVEMLKLEGRDPEVTVRLDTTIWYVDREHRPINRVQASSVAFEADKRLCALLCMHQEAKREWVNLSGEEKVRFADFGPPGPAIRRKLWRSAMDTLDEVSA